jgi:thymidylate synthase
MEFRKVGDRTFGSTFNVNSTYFDIGKNGAPIQKSIFEQALVTSLWLLGGASNVNLLNKFGFTDENFKANDAGDIEMSEGRMLRQFPSGNTIKLRNANTLEGATNELFFADQLAFIISELKENVNTTRAVANLWYPARAQIAAFPPRIVSLIFSRHETTLNLHVTMRSCDLEKDLPLDTAILSIVLCLVAHICKLEPDCLALTVVSGHFTIKEEDVHHGLYDLNKFQINIDGDLTLENLQELVFTANKKQLLEKFQLV